MLNPIRRAAALRPTSRIRTGPLLGLQRNFAQVADPDGLEKTAAPAPAPFLLEELPEVLGRDEDAIRKLPPFVISRQRGFLPRQDPMPALPAQFVGLTSLLERMTIHQPADASGKRPSGLLALGQFGDAISHELRPDGPEVQAVKAAIASGDSQLISALFRDYCFATSAYLLEPVDRSYRETGLYAPGRDVLPAQLAVPLSLLANKLGHFPYMEYASSYALTNYRVKDQNHGGPAGKYGFDNMELIRSFEDAQGSERGFILVHVEMVAHSGALVAGAEDALRAALGKDVASFERAFENLLHAYRRINVSMDTMWGRSAPSDYLKFRSFIFGTGPAKMNAMFPTGVLYEGVSDVPQYFRGESGANDSMVPLGDNLLEITAHLPQTPLTETLRDFRSYRPRNQREYLSQLEVRATHAGVRQFAMHTSGSAKAKALYLLLVDQIREFRDRHWRFTNEYIIKRSTYDIATGGSPILKYLPHNLDVVLRVLEQSYADFSPADETALLSLSADTDSAAHAHAHPGTGTVTGMSGPEILAAVHLAGKHASAQRRILKREVAKLVAQRENNEVGRGMLGEPKRLQRGAVGCDGVG